MLLVASGRETVSGRVAPIIFLEYIDKYRYKDVGICEAAVLR